MELLRLVKEWYG